MLLSLSVFYAHPKDKKLGLVRQCKGKTVARFMAAGLEIKQLQRYPGSSRIQQAFNHILLSSLVEAKLFLVWILRKELTAEETPDHHT